MDENVRCARIDGFVDLAGQDVCVSKRRESPMRECPLISTRRRSKRRGTSECRSSMYTCTVHRHSRCVRRARCCALSPAHALQSLLQKGSSAWLLRNSCCLASGALALMLYRALRSAGPPLALTARLVFTQRRACATGFFRLGPAGPSWASDVATRVLPRRAWDRRMPLASGLRGSCSCTRSGSTRAQP
jgi:hypothetical protein